jgi:hypothetical protein
MRTSCFPVNSAGPAIGVALACRRHNERLHAARVRQLGQISLNMVAVSGAGRDSLNDLALPVDARREIYVVYVVLLSQCPKSSRATSADGHSLPQAHPYGQNPSSTNKKYCTQYGL